MAGLLEGQLAKALFAGFKGKLLKGTLKRVAADPAAGLDRYGDPRDHTHTEWSCEGFVEMPTRRFGTKDQVPTTDATIFIFAASLPSGTRPELDDMAQFPKTTGPWYQIKTPAETDPATALWKCGAVLIKGSGDDCRARAP